MGKAIIVKEIFRDGIIQIRHTTDGAQFIYKVTLGYENKINNLYVNTRNYIKDYYDTSTQGDKKVRLDNIKLLIEQFDSIKEFCKQKIPANGKLVMEEEFETLYCQLKNICS